MKVKMLIKGGMGDIRHGDVFETSPQDAEIGVRAGVLALVEPAPPAPLAAAGKSFADFCRAVNRRDTPYLARHYDSHFLPAETDHLAPRQKAALAESGGPLGGYTVPAEYAAGMMTVAAENAVVRPSAAVASMHSATLQVPYIDMTTVQAAGVSPYFGGVQMKWAGEAQTRTESEPQFKQVELKAWELSGSAVVSRPLLDDAEQAPADPSRPADPNRSADPSRDNQSRDRKGAVVPPPLPPSTSTSRRSSAWPSPGRKITPTCKATASPSRKAS